MKDFKIKTAEELEKMETSELISYFNDLNAHKAEELTELKKELEKKSNDDVQAKIDALKAEINESNLEQMKTLQKALEEQGLAIRKIMADGGKKTIKSLSAILEDKADDLKAIKSGESKRIKLTVDKATVLTSSVADSTEGMRLPSVGQIARAKAAIRNLFLTGTISPGQGGVVRYVDQATNTNGAAMQTEGAKKGEGAITWIEKSMDLQTVAEWIKVSRQALTDFAFIESEIRNKLVLDLVDKVEDEVWDGTGTAPELKGIYTYADTYTAAASGITDANIYDLIVKVIENISKDTSYIPNFAIMNIADINKMKLKKDANNNYILPPFTTDSGMTVDGVSIIASSQVTAGTMLVGDFSKAILYTLGSVDIMIGYENDDFTKNLVTILAEERLGLLVRSVDTGAFNKVTSISAALTTLATA